MPVRRPYVASAMRGASYVCVYVLCLCVRVCVAGRVVGYHQAAGESLSGDDLKFAQALLSHHERAADKQRGVCPCCRAHHPPCSLSPVAHARVLPTDMQGIVVDYHPAHPESLCLQVVRSDGSREDFSWVKCVQRAPAAASGQGSATGGAGRKGAVSINPGATLGRRFGGGRRRGGGRGGGRGRRGGGRRW